MLFRTGEVLLNGGPASVLRKIKNRCRLARNLSDVLPRAPGARGAPSLNRQYPEWLVQHELTATEMEQMATEMKAFVYTPLISVLIPVFNTAEAWLRRAVESVRSQVYDNWEICLVNDGSTNDAVRSILDSYAGSDRRIRVKHLPANLGIAGASSEALAMAEGEFVALLDHDDEITPDALWEIVRRLNRNPDVDLLYSDEDKLSSDGSRIDPFFKPEWSPDLLLSMNYIAHFCVFRRTVLESVGGFRPGYDGAQDYDVMLRFTERTERIAHIPKILYHWRVIPGSSAEFPAAKPHALENGRRAIEDALRRRGRPGAVYAHSPGKYLVRYEIRDSAKISVIIPTRDHWELLKRCLASIEERTRYSTYEIIIVDNGSTDPQTVQYLDALSSDHRVLRYPKPFNFSALINFGAAHATGEYLLLLNDDTEAIAPEWLTAMVEQAQRPEVGVVGGKLLYPDKTIQHAGVLVGYFGGAGHAFRNLPDNGTAYFGFADVVRNCSAVTAACMMVRRPVFQQIGGFDETLGVVYNDVDFCMRVRKQGYLVIYTPLAVLWHLESASRGRLRPSKEEDLFYRRWREWIDRGDPYYNPNLSLTREDWTLRI
jgi:GT2 family glycosyltransferase